MPREYYQQDCTQSIKTRKLCNKLAKQSDSVQCTRTQKETWKLNSKLHYSIPPSRRSQKSLKVIQATIIALFVEYVLERKRKRRDQRPMKKRQAMHSYTHAHTLSSSKP